MILRRQCERAPPNARSGLQAPPAFLERPKEEYFQEVGRELLIPCSARGDPSPTISWAKVRLLTPLHLYSHLFSHSPHPCLSVPLDVLGERGGGEEVRKRRLGGEEGGAAPRVQWRPW